MRRESRLKCRPTSRQPFFAFSTRRITVTEELVLRPLLQDRGHITESICVLMTVNRIKQKCFLITTKRVRRKLHSQ